MSCCALLLVPRASHAQHEKKLALGDDCNCASLTAYFCDGRLLPKHNAGNEIRWKQLQGHRPPRLAK
jgi:hypothetical protein